MFKSNCLKCGSIRSVKPPRSDTDFHICKKCGAKFYIKTRKKKFYPDTITQKLLSSADKYRASILYNLTVGKLTISERENVKSIMSKAIMRFRGNGRLELRENDIKHPIHLLGRIKTPEDNEIDVPTNMSVEEYKAYLATDPQRKKTILFDPFSRNLYVTFMRECKVNNQSKHIVEIGADVNYANNTAAIRIDGKKVFFVVNDYPEEKIRKLLNAKNRCKEKNKQSLIQNKIKKIKRGVYLGFIETVHKMVREKLRLKNNKSIKYIWCIEDPNEIRKMHSQYSHQGWCPSELDKWLKEKSSHMYLNIVYKNPAYTSIKCSSCGKINKREGDKLNCECGLIIGWHENTTLNLLQSS